MYVENLSWYYIVFCGCVFDIIDLIDEDLEKCFFMERVDKIFEIFDILIFCKGV